MLWQIFLESLSVHIVDKVHKTFITKNIGRLNSIDFFHNSPNAKQY